MSLGLRIAEFARSLRSYDFVIGTGQIEDVLRAGSFIDIGDRREFYLATRAVLLSDHERQPLFDALFEQYWDPKKPPAAAPPRALEGPPPVPGNPTGAALGSYSPFESFYQQDFSVFTPDEMPAVARACATLARKIATRRSRRLRPARRGSLIDRRGSVRRNLKYGGIPLELTRLEHRLRKPRVVLLCDVSRSMEPYSVFLLHFIYSMQHLAGRVESFVFATSLTRVTEYFHRADIHSAIDAIVEEVPDWGGGTRIGQSLQTFNQEYAWRLVDGRTTVIALSDGLDTGDTALLGEQMAELHKMASRLIWLNPVLDTMAGQPLAHGMAAALPHLDLLAPASNLAGLQQFVRGLVRRRGGLRATAPKVS